MPNGANLLSTLHGVYHCTPTLWDPILIRSKAILFPTWRSATLTTALANKECPSTEERSVTNVVEENNYFCYFTISTETKLIHCSHYYV